MSKCKREMFAGFGQGVIQCLCLFLEIDLDFLSKNQGTGYTICKMHRKKLAIGYKPFFLEDFDRSPILGGCGPAPISKKGR